MTSREPHEFLQDILTSARLAREYLAGWDLAAFERAIEKRDSVIHRLEIIGEAAGNLPDDITRAMPDVPWAQIKGMRNLMVHQYWEINVKRIWSVVHEHLPQLISAVEAYLSGDRL